MLQQAMPKLMAEFARLKHIQVVDDHSVGRGGCVLTYGQGRVDGRIEKQLERVVEQLCPNGAGAQVEGRRSKVSSTPT